MLTLIEYFIFTIFMNVCSGLTCDDVKNAKGGAASMSADVLAALAPSEVDQCLAELGKDRLNPNQAKVLWNSLIKQYEAQDEIPNEKLRLLGWITIGITAEEYRNISMDDPDLIQAFGLYHGLNLDQLKALADQVRETCNKLPEEMSMYDLIAMRQILCGFNKSDIEHIHPDAYKEAANILGTLRECPEEIIQGLAKLAVHKDAFGPPSEWTPIQAITVGNIINGLNDQQVKSFSSEVQAIIAEKFKN